MDRPADSSPAEVWLVSSDQWMRAALRAELLERGVETIGFAGAVDALAALEQPGARPPRLMLVDLRGERTGPGMLAALKRTGVPLALLGGGVELGADVVQAMASAAVFRLPVALGTVAAAVQGLLGADPQMNAGARR